MPNNPSSSMIKTGTTFFRFWGKPLSDCNVSCKAIALPEAEGSDQGVRLVDRKVLRPALAQLFATLNRTNKFLRNRAMRAAHFEHGYRQKEIADHLGRHDTTVSNILRRVR
jgi:hypothetical protein